MKPIPYPRITSAYGSTFKARYPGNCRQCESPIHVGDIVRKRAHVGGYVHVDCAARHDDEREKAAWAAWHAEVKG